MSAISLRVINGPLTGDTTIYLAVELVGLPPPAHPSMPVGEVVTIFANGAKVYEGLVYTRSPVVGIPDLPPGRYTFYTSNMSPEGSTAVVNILPSIRGSAGHDLIASPYPDFALYGQEGNDTLVGSAGADLLVGGEGADTFAWAREPWAPATVKDFIVGVDRLDFGAVFKGANYPGTDPVADGRIILVAQGGDTAVLFDDDGAGGDWPNYILKLEGVLHQGLTWGQLSTGATPPPPAPLGQVINSPGPGSTLPGGTGADTLNASQGPDVLTGGAGSDAFVYKALPWNAGRITDFTLGSDRLDLSAIFQASGYTGSDPVADGQMRFDSDGAGGTRVYFDTDAPNAGEWPFLITTLNNVSPTGLSWAQLSGGGGPQPGEGRVLTWRQHGDILTGGAGYDTINASRGSDQLTGADGADHFAWAELPWNAGHVTDFTPGTDKLDLRALFAASGYAGSDPLADGRLEFRADGSGNTQVYFEADAPGSGDWPWLITTLDALTPSQLGAGDWVFR